MNAPLRLGALLDGNPHYRRFRQISGIGPITALTILAVAGDLGCLTHHQQFLKFFSLDPATQHLVKIRGIRRGESAEFWPPAATVFSRRAGIARCCAASIARSWRLKAIPWRQQV